MVKKSYLGNVPNRIKWMRRTGGSGDRYEVNPQSWTQHLRSYANSNFWMPLLFALARIRTYVSCSPLFIVVVT